MAEVNNFYAEQTTLQTTGNAGATDVPGTTISGASLAANTKYLVIAKALFGGDDVSGTFQLRVRAEDDLSVLTTKSIATIEPTFTATDELEPYFFVHSFTSDASPGDVRFQFNRVSAGDTCAADQLSLLLIDLDDLGSSNYFEDIHADDSVEYTTSFADAAALAAADLGITEEWLLLGYQRTGIGSTGRNFDIDLFAADDASSQSQLNFHSAEGEDTNELRVVGVAGRHKAVTSNVAAAIRVLEEASNANALNRGGYLIALKASAFANFKFDFVSGGIVIASTETTVASIVDYTPSTATNHLIIGRMNDQDVTRNTRVVLYVENGTGTNLMVGDDLAFQTQDWDDTDQSMVVTAMRESLPTTQDTFDLQALKDSGQTVGSRSFQRRWLLMLNLEKASVDGDVLQDPIYRGMVPVPR